MDNIRRFLLRRGQICTIQRNPPINSRVSMKLTTKAMRDESARESYWEGIVLADSNLTSGEIITINGLNFLTQTVLPNPQGELLWYGVKTNSQLELIQEQETVDDNGYIIKTPIVVATIPAYGTIITATLRQQQPGLLPNSIWLFQIPSSYGVKTGDKLRFSGRNIRVEAANILFLGGVTELQCSEVVA